MRNFKNRILTAVVLGLRTWSLRLESRRIQKVLKRHGIPTMLMLALSASLLAESQKPFDPTTLGFHVAYVNGRVAPEVDLAVRLGNAAGGFTTYSITGFLVNAAGGSPVQLQASAVTGVAMVRPLGEYLYFGPLGQLGVTNNGKNTGMLGKADFVAGYRLFKSQHWSVEGIAGASKSPLGNYVPEAALGLRYGFNAKVVLPVAKK